MPQNNIKVLVIEDGPFQAEILHNKLVSEGYDVMGPYANGTEALLEVEKVTDIPDVAILDIEIQGDKDGIEIAKILHLKHDVSIIFLSHLQDEITRKRLGDVPAIFYSKSNDNLINNMALFDAIDRSVEKNTSNKNQSSSVDKSLDLKAIKHKNGSKIITTDEIMWVEADGEVAFIYFEDSSKQIAKGTLKEIEAKLQYSPPKFARISKKHLVNLEQIAGIKTNHIDEDGKKREVVEMKVKNVKLNIGRSYKPILKKLLEEL